MAETLKKEQLITMRKSDLDLIMDLMTLQERSRGILKKMDEEMIRLKKRFAQDRDEKMHLSGQLQKALDLLKQHNLELK